jgi:hypothetical protein
VTNKTSVSLLIKIRDLPLEGGIVAELLSLERQPALAGQHAETVENYRFNHRLSIIEQRTV